MNIQKLLDSNISEDILLAVELMRYYTLEQIKILLPELVQVNDNKTFYTKEAFEKNSNRTFMAQIEVTNGIFLVDGTKLWYTEDIDSETCKLWGYPKV